MVAVGNDELENNGSVGRDIYCDKCGEYHEIIYGDEILKDGARVLSKIMAFYKCGDKTYLAGIDGKLIYKQGGVMDILYCEDCGEECEIVEETFGYAGTHCTNGNSGTHHTGVYLSKCCLADFTDYSKKQLEDNSEQEG